MNLYCFIGWHLTSAVSGVKFEPLVVAFEQEVLVVRPKQAVFGRAGDLLDRVEERAVRVGNPEVLRLSLLVDQGQEKEGRDEIDEALVSLLRGEGIVICIILKTKG